MTVAELTVAPSSDPAVRQPLHQIQSDFLEWLKTQRLQDIKPIKGDILLALLDCWVANLEGFSLVAEKQTKSQCFIWNGLFYENTPRSFFGRNLRRILKGACKTRYSTGVRDEIFKLVLDEWNLDPKIWMKINNYDNISPFKNGYYFRKEKTFVSHEGPRGSMAPNPDYFFTTTIDADFQETPQKTPKFTEFLNGLVEDEDDRNFVLDYLSYCLTSNIGWQTHMILVGPPDCGKSEFLLIIDYLLPQLICHISFDKLLNKKDNKFIGKDIKGKWVNNGAELTVKSLDASGVGDFKTFVTERSIRAEQKGVDAYYVANMLKGVYSLNETPPMVEGLDKAFFQRIKIIPCKTGHTEVIKEYMREIFEEEGDDIASMLVQRPPPEYKRIDYLETMKRWNENLPSGFRYAEECLEPSMEKVGTSCEWIRENYAAWCEKNDEYMQPAKVFGKHLAQAGIDRKQVRVERQHYWTYKVLFKEETKTEYGIADIDPYRPLPTEEDLDRWVQYGGN